MAKKYIQSIFSYIQNIFFIEDTIEDLFWLLTQDLQNSSFKIIMSIALIAVFSNSVWKEKKFVKTSSGTHSHCDFKKKL